MHDLASNVPHIECQHQRLTFQMILTALSKQSETI
jgi:hypothetical protein